MVGEALQRGLHALAHRDVLDVDDEVDGLTIGVAHQRARDLGPDEPPASGEVDLLHRIALGLPVEQGCDLLAVGIEVLRVRDRREGEGQELLLGVAHDLAQRAVDLEEGAVEVDERHADRRVGEGALEAQVGLLPRGARRACAP